MQFYQLKAWRKANHFFKGVSRKRKKKFFLLLMTFVGCVKKGVEKGLFTNYLTL